MVHQEGHEDAHTMTRHEAILIAQWPPRAPVIPHDACWGGLETGCRIHILSPCGEVGTNICGLSGGIDIICAAKHRHTGIDLCMN